MYHFEPAGEYLCARDATRLTHVERAARRVARPARALLAELLAAPAALLALPVHVAVQLERFAMPYYYSMIHFRLNLSNSDE